MRIQEIDVIEYFVVTFFNWNGVYPILHKITNPHPALAKLIAIHQEINVIECFEIVFSISIIQFESE